MTLRFKYSSICPTAKYNPLKWKLNCGCSTSLECGHSCPIRKDCDLQSQKSWTAGNLHAAQAAEPTFPKLHPETELCGEVARGVKNGWWRLCSLFYSSWCYKQAEQRNRISICVYVWAGNEASRAEPKIIHDFFIILVFSLNINPSIIVQQLHVFSFAKIKTENKQNLYMLKITTLIPSGFEACRRVHSFYDRMHWVIGSHCHCLNKGQWILTFLWPSMAF